MSSEIEVIKPFTGELSENAQKNFTKMKKALTTLNKHRGGSVSFVIVDANNKFNGAERRGDTIYIAADTLERDAGTSYLDEASRSGNFAGTMLHEYDHTNEGTREHAALNSFLAEDEENSELGIRNSELGADGRNINAENLDSKAEKGYNYSRKNYSDTEYRDYGWARESGVLSASENSKLRSLFAEAVSGQAKPPKTKAGEYMIAVGDKVDNKIAYMTGSIDSPVITRILEIDEKNETQLDELRRETYAIDRRGVQRKTGGPFNTYTSASFGSSIFEQRSSVQSERHNYKLGIVGGRSSKTASRIKEILFDDNGNIVSETRYSYKAPAESKVYERIAEWEKLKVYTKAEISKMVESLSGLSSVPKRFRTEIVNDIWTAFNSRYSPEQRERHASFLADKIFARVMQESGDAFDNTSQEDIYAMEREIHKALKKIAREGGSPSTRSKLEAEFNTSEAGYWKKQRDEALEKMLGFYR